MGHNIELLRKQCVNKMGIMVSDLWSGVPNFNHFSIRHDFSHKKLDFTSKNV
jgi:hypothetical protein